MLNFIWAPLIAVMETVGKAVSFDFLAIGAAALLLIVFVATFLRTRFTYEFQMLKSVRKLNKYFEKSPFINDDNLVAFNNIMKSVPKNLRTCWQEYVLNRDKFPSDYMNVYACIEQPIKTSSYGSATSICGYFVSIIAVLSALIGFARLYVSETLGFTEILLFTATIPALVAVIGLLFISYLKNRRAAITSNLYSEFHDFERKINKACETLPEYIDYEVLFTKREIKESIPVLQDYLEKRKLQEQKRLEEEEFNAISYDNFDFTSLGIDNSLLLERAMKESQRFLNIKSALQQKINTNNGLLDNYQKNFDEVTKNFERKAQSIRETLAEINEKITKTSTQIDRNYLLKNQADAQKDLQQLEKDYERSSAEFQKEQDKIQGEIDILKAEIEKRKTGVEEAMTSECKKYAGKVHATMKDAVMEQSKPVLEEIEKRKTELELQIAELNSNYELNNEKNEQLQTELNELQQKYTTKTAEIAAIDNLKQFFTSKEFAEKLMENANAITIASANNSNGCMSLQEYSYKKKAMQENPELAMESENVAPKTVVNNSESKISFQELTTLKKELQDKNSELFSLHKRVSELERQLEKAKNAAKEIAENMETAKLLSRKSKPVERMGELEEIQKSIEEANAELIKEQNSFDDSFSDALSKIGTSKSKSKTATKSSAGAKPKTKTTNSKKTERVNKINTSLTDLVKVADSLESKRIKKED